MKTKPAIATGILKKFESTTNIYKENGAGSLDTLEVLHPGKPVISKETGKELDGSFALSKNTILIKGEDGSISISSFSKIKDTEVVLFLSEDEAAMLKRFLK